MDQPTVPDRELLPTHGPRRWLNIVLGLFFVGLAALGVVLPVLPTTPFLILASACFVRSSPRLNSWLLHTRLFGPLLRDWQQHRRVSRRVKHLAVVLILVFVTLSAWLGDFSWPWLVALIVLALIGLAVVLRLPEKPDPALQEIAEVSAAPANGDLAAVEAVRDGEQHTMNLKEALHGENQG